MKSPFPGMDPYLERHWLDVHARLVFHAADQLNEQLPRSLVARMEERIIIDTDEADDLRTAPDVRIFEPGVSDVETSGLLYSAPLKLVVDLDPLKQRFIQILEGGERLITVIEFVSATNKIGNGMMKFRKKRSQTIRGGVHVVEIDLVRRGDWRALMRPHVCARRFSTEYRATVRLGGDRQSAYVYPAPLRAQLPVIKIPLRKDDPETRVNVQELVDLAYTRGRYGETIDYRRPLDLPLSPEDAAWAETLLRESGKI